MIPLNKWTRFYNYPYTIDEANIILFGAPYNISPGHIATRYRNTSFLREASIWNEDNSLSTPQYYSKIKVHDAGDITNEEDIKKIIESLPSYNAKPVMFGGPHKYTYYTVRELKPDTLIIMDAHLDLKKEFLGETFSNATFLRKINEEKNANEILYIGVRAYDDEEKKYLDSNPKIEIVTPPKLEKYIENNKTLYLSLDIDFLDASYITETPYPEYWGHTPAELINILKILVKKKAEIIGADIMEYIPYRGRHSEAKLVSRIILEIISMINYIDRGI